MEENQNDTRYQTNDGMSKEKTNQDFNKQKPNPNDPNQTLNNPGNTDQDYDIADKDETEEIGKNRAGYAQGDEGIEDRTEDMDDESNGLKEEQTPLMKNENRSDEQGNRRPTF